MPHPQQRLRLTLQIPCIPPLTALPRADLTPEELVAAVLARLGDRVPHLGRDATRYELLVAGNIALNKQLPLAQQVAAGMTLVLGERLPPLPEGTWPVAARAYLRALDTGQVMPIAWQPAIIGCPRPDRGDNEHILFDLSLYRQGNNLSRRQARISEAGGCFLIEPLSDRSPTSLLRAGGDQLLSPGAHPMRAGDVIAFRASPLKLQFLQPDDAN